MTLMSKEAILSSTSSKDLVKLIGNMSLRRLGTVLLITTLLAPHLSYISGDAGDQVVSVCSKNETNSCSIRLISVLAE